MPRLSIVVPVYNSSDCLKELAKRIHTTLKNDYELILINDQSLDNSWDIICQLVNEYDNLTGINLRINSGQDNAIMAGLRQCNGEYVVIMDDDLQHAPEDIPALYKRCSDGFDICFADFDSKKQKWWKNIGSWLNGKVAELIINKSRQMYLSPYKIMRNEIAKAICAYDGPFPYIDGLILTVTNNVTKIKVEHYNRFSGKSTYSFRRSISVLGKHVTGFSILPLRIASIIGFGAAFIGLCLAIYYVSYYFQHGSVPGWTTLVFIILLMGGLILMSLGVIGEYIGRIYLKINNRPQYIIKDILRKS
ncbi:glycosyltransferase family 2 protein [Thermodesulfobacteriota bacterium]